MKKRQTCLLVIALTSSGLLLAQSTSTDDSTTEVDNPVYITPVIEKYGKVVHLPDAAQQPREGSRIVVDITHGGDPAELAGAYDKVCRYVNIYGGAGKESHEVKIAVVLHGTATLTALNDDAYAHKFHMSNNPNLPCLRELKKAGVDFYVCGQSLAHKDATPDQVTEEVQVAVSALTALVNLQADGYAYVPLGI